MRELDSFFHDIGYRLKIAQDTKKLLDKRLASSFSLFPYIAPNENRISEIIRDLLDPNGNHGQGDIFLQKFLEVIGKSDIYEIGDQAEIRTEEPTTSIENNRRRIDIIIEIKRNNHYHSGIAIENKPWAIDQKNQVYDYFLHIKSRYPNNHYIIYLTPDGRKPPPHSAQKIYDNHIEKLICMSYQTDIASWLNVCYKESQADYVRHFLLDFLNYCQQPNLSATAMNNTQITSDTIINYILDNPKTNLKIAEILHENFGRIKHRIIIDFSKKLEQSLQNTFAEYSLRSTLDKHPSDYTGIYLSKDTWPLEVTLENQEKDAGFFCIGICLKTEKTINKEIYDLIFSSFRSQYSRSNRPYDNRSNGANIYLTPLPNNKFLYWNSSLIESNTIAIEYITNEFRRILEIIKPIIKQHQEILI